MLSSSLPVFRLLVGLGNPGEEYTRTRHNIGFRLLDALLSAGSGATPERRKFQGLLSEMTFDGRPFFCLKPQTYMNLSGESVRAAAQFYKILPEEILVLHDEMALPFGKIRLKQGGGHAGHNGLKSLDQHLGPNYWRLRLGVGHPGDAASAAPHVLGAFSKLEESLLAEWLRTLVAEFPCLLQKGPDAYMSRVAAHSSPA